MNKMIVTIMALFLSISMVNASDFAKEQRWIEQIADFIIDGDVEMLPVGEREILSIYTEAEDNAKKRGIIVVHGLGAHPDWTQIVQTVRVEMTTKGWNTLSIQMPILANGVSGDEYAVLFDEVTPRINAAIHFLKEQGINDIVLVSHSMGSAMSAYYFSSNPKSMISRFVAVGLGGAQKNKKMNGANSIENIHIPMLDLFGSDDLPGVMSSVKARSSAAKKAGNKMYKQVEVKGAEHFFDGYNDVLIKTINDWLEQN